MIIDSHGHIPPETYIKELMSHKNLPRILKGDNNSLIIEYGEGYQYTIDDRMYSIDTKLEAMKKSSVDMQILGIIMPGLDTLDAEIAYTLTQKVNDEYADIQEKYHDTFLTVGAIPLQYPEFAIEELRRIKKDLGMMGVEVFSNINGTPLDSPKFYPFFREAESLNIPLLLHPSLPLIAEATKPYGLTGAVGYLFDTTIAILRIIYSGILEKFPKLRIVLPHMGSTIPYLIGRIDNQFKINPESQEKISKLPSEYFKLIYVDTAQSLYRPAIECAYQLIGSKKILFGTDYPFADLSKSIQAIKNLDISDEAKEDIFENNARSMFNIK
jgi:predicted TIM-barrel fold metal-dependent hydrolase